MPCDGHSSGDRDGVRGARYTARPNDKDLPMALSEPEKRYLRGLAHARKPVVTVGQAGFTQAVLAELQGALDHHELLKVRVSLGERGLRDAVIADILAQSGAELVQRIGNVAVLYRANPLKKPPLALP
jgi:RNA-binding protein